MATKHSKVSNCRDELIPKVVDHLANTMADEPYALYPNSPLTYDHGYRTVTYKDFANAINGIAWWLHKTLGPSDNFHVLAYIGPNDVRYNALMLAATKAGYLVRISFQSHDLVYLQCRLSSLLRATASLPTCRCCTKPSATYC
jgi:acyl-coenzyme A synthetase/AMP-(fatty) acid ligase